MESLQNSRLSFKWLLCHGIRGHKIWVQKVTSNHYHNYRCRCAVKCWVNRQIYLISRQKGSLLYIHICSIHIFDQLHKGWLTGWILTKCCEFGNFSQHPHGHVIRDAEPRTSQQTNWSASSFVHTMQRDSTFTQIGADQSAPDCGQQLCRIQQVKSGLSSMGDLWQI